MKKVKYDMFTDTDLVSLFDRIEAVIEAWLNSGHEIISVNFIPNTQPNMVIVYHSYEIKEPVHDYGW